MRVRSTLLLCLCCCLSGCAAMSMRSQSPEDIAAAVPDTPLVGGIAVPDGMEPVAVESLALVTGLADTGSDPGPGPERSALLDEMQKRGVVNPNQVLASNSTSLVMVRGYLRAGVQEGDRFDVEIRVPSRSETKSLRDGWLMDTRLREMAALKNQIHEGHTLALARGAVLVDPAAEMSGDKVSLARGRILGGGIALKSRPLRMVLKPDYRSVRNSASIETALNRRFHSFKNGVKQGIAKAKTDEYVELTVHPRYKDNIPRYMQVLRAVALRESSAEESERIKLLERQLLDPITADSASLKLEAIGKSAADSLAKGLGSNDALVRFYSAQSLAYLDDNRAVPALAQSCQEPAFRVFALSALGAMDDFNAAQALRDMLEVPSAETRYGAFRALWSMKNPDALTRGEQLGEQFSYHVLPIDGPSMIHLTRSYRAEVVLFGTEHRLKTPIMIDASGRLLIKAESPGEVIISRFTVGNDVERRTVDNNIDSIIRAIVDLGGTYPDVVQFLQQAKQKRALSSRLEVDALPQANREYERGGEAGEGTLDRAPVVSNPLPDLFATPKEETDRERKRRQAEEDKSASTDPPPTSQRPRGLLAKLKG